MSGNIMTSKRAARIERRKSRVAAIFKIGDNEAREFLKCQLRLCINVLILLQNEASPLKTEAQQNEPDVKRPRLSDEEYLSLRMKLREKKRSIQVCHSYLIYFHIFHQYCFP